MAETSVNETIARRNAAFDAAFNRGDAAALGALYVEDAVLLPPGAPIQKGRAAIRTFWEGMIREFANLHLMTVDLEPYGDNVLREIGQLTVEVKAAAGETLRGKYVVIWENIGGEWKLATDIANFDSE